MKPAQIQDTKLSEDMGKEQLCGLKGHGEIRQRDMAQGLGKLVDLCKLRCSTVS